MGKKILPCIERWVALDVRHELDGYRKIFLQPSGTPRFFRRFYTTISQVGKALVDINAFCPLFPFIFREAQFGWMEAKMSRERIVLPSRAF